MLNLHELTNNIKIKNLKQYLINNNITLIKGLSDEEFIKIEKIYGLEFPKDLKMIYKNFLPISKGFYNWKDFSENNITNIKKMINWPLEGILIDIENNDFWLECFGGKTENLEENLNKAQNYYNNNVHKLIPVFSHRYIPSYPNDAGNPIFSVHQTDIIYYGNNIFDYFRIEFSNQNLHQEMLKTPKKQVPFWSDIVS